MGKVYQFTSGHWLSMLSSTSQTIDVLDAIRQAPGLRGVMLRYQWGKMAQDKVLQDLNMLAQFGLRGIVMVEDKSFANGDNPMPAGYEQYAVKNVAGGYTALRWNETVNTLFLDMVDDLYQKFGNHLAFEGMALQESAPGLSPDQYSQTGYVATKYADALVNIFNKAYECGPGTESFPAKRVFWFQNYAPGGAIDMAMDRVILNGLDNVVFGGPDCWWLDQQMLDKVYPRYTKYMGKAPMFIGMTKESYQQKEANGTIAPISEGYAFARDVLRVSYVLWSYGPWFPKAVPVINAGWK